VIVALLPLIAVVLVLFLITGLAIPALPLHVRQELGLGTFVVGLSPEPSSRHRWFLAYGRAVTPTSAVPSEPLSPPGGGGGCRLALHSVARVRREIEAVAVVNS
jgi:hypothetical protein